MDDNNACNINDDDDEIMSSVVSEVKCSISKWQNALRNIR